MRYRVRPLEVEALQFTDWASGTQIADIVSGVLHMGTHGNYIEMPSENRIYLGDYLVIEPNRRVWRKSEFETVYEIAKDPIVLSINGDRIL